MTHQVYVIGSPSATVVKIGYSSNPQRRLADLQSGSPLPLTVLATFDGGKDLESALHRHFKTERRHGEWFELGSDPVGTVQAAVADAFRNPAPITGPDCTCGHARHFHQSGPCSVVGWDEWLDCRCVRYARVVSLPPAAMSA